MSEIDWAAIHAGLCAPFDPADVDFRPHGGLNEKGDGMTLAYIDARAVMDRLDAVVGAANWYGFPDVVVADSAVRVVRYGLTIHGVTKYAIGDAADTEASKSADSDGLKRAGVPWGIGRYLYALPREWVKGESRGKNWSIPEAEIKRLRAKLGGQAPQRAVAAQDARPRQQATPNAPTPIRAASAPASAPPESAGAAFKRAASTAGLSEDEQKALIKQTYPNRGFSTLTEAEWHKLEQKCRAMYSDVPAPEEAPLF